MKKTSVLGLILAAALLLIMAGEALALQEADTEVASYDIVILIDQSTSMNSPHNREFRSDPDARRLDAAQAIIGMCDMENSRVAIVTFYGDITTRSDTGFEYIGDAASRLKKMKSLDDERLNSLGGNTDYGNALNYAVKLLIEREDKANAPMIILITDGANELTKTNGKYSSRSIYVWDQATNTYSEVRVNEYGVDNDNTHQNRGQTSPINATTQQEAAVKAAQANNIPIFTVALRRDSKRADYVEEVKFFTGQLRTVAQLTGGRYIELPAARIHELPFELLKAYAVHTGRLLVENLPSERCMGTARTYKVSVPVPNRSVKEISICIPREHVDASSITLHDAAGANHTGGSRYVTYLPAEQLVIYKITSPETLGDWELQYDLLPDEESPWDVNIGLLYHYDVSFVARAGSSAEALKENGETVVLNSEDTLYITAGFYGADPVTGGKVPIKDSFLYARPVEGSAAQMRIIKRISDAELPSASSNGWETVRVTYNFVDAYGKTVYYGDLTSDNAERFSVELDLSAVDTSSVGYSGPLTGDYTLVIVADGAGLHREYGIPVTIVD